LFTGYDAGRWNTTGSNNAFVGYQAGAWNATGYSNTAVGAWAGYYFNGSRNTFIGDSADATTSGLTNAAAIGYNAKVSRSNSIVLGDGNANIGIGTASPQAAIDVAKGDVYIEDYTRGIIMKDANGKCYRITVNTSGTLVATAIACP
jgi:hypothetical protein